MSRRKALLAALALCGGLAVSTAPLSSAAPNVPPQCGPHPVLTQYEGNYYVSTDVGCDAYRSVTSRTHKAWFDPERGIRRVADLEPTDIV